MVSGRRRTLRGSVFHAVAVGMMWLTHVEAEGGRSIAPSVAGRLPWPLPLASACPPQRPVALFSLHAQHTQTRAHSRSNAGSPPAPPAHLTIRTLVLSHAYSFWKLERSQGTKPRTADGPARPESTNSTAVPTAVSTAAARAKGADLRKMTRCWLAGRGVVG